MGFTGHPENRLHQDVKAVLSETLGEAYFQQHVYTPYYYYLDMECVLDSKHRPMSCKELGLKPWSLDTHLKEKIPDDAQRYVLVACI